MLLCGITLNPHACIHMVIPSLLFFLVAFLSGTVPVSSVRTRNTVLPTHSSSWSPRVVRIYFATLVKVRCDPIISQLRKVDGTNHHTLMEQISLFLGRCALVSVYACSNAIPLDTFCLFLWFLVSTSERQNGQSRHRKRELMHHPAPYSPM